MPNETDDALMLAVRDGSLDAMGMLFERHHRRMYRFFRRSIPEVSTCEDLVQGLFVRMLERRAGYRGGSFAGWMYRIAINLRNDHLRRARREGPTYGRGPIEGAAGAGTATEFDAARLRAAVDALRPAERDVLMLTRFEGLSHAEAAEVLGCSVGALKVRVHRALQALRRRYEERGGPPWV